MSGSPSHGWDEVIIAESNQMRRNSSSCRRLTITPSKSLFPRYVTYFHCVPARQHIVYSPLIEDYCIQIEHGEFIVNDLLLVSNMPSRQPLLEFMVATQLRPASSLQLRSPSPLMLLSNFWRSDFERLAGM